MKDLSTRTPAAGVPISWHLPEGGKTVITAVEDGHLPGAVCPVCGNESIYMVEAIDLRVVSLAGAAVKFNGEFGVQAVCGTDDCTMPDSPVVTMSRPRSYER